MRWRFSVLLLMFGAACGDPGPDEHPPVSDPGPLVLPSEPRSSADEETSFVDDVAVGSCKHEQKRDCKVLVSIHNDVKTCVVGEQRCEGGRWGECKGRQREEGGAGAAGAESQ